MYSCVFCNEFIPNGQRVCRECMIQRTAIHTKDKKTAILECLKKNHTGKRNAVQLFTSAKSIRADGRHAGRHQQILNKRDVPRKRFVRRKIRHRAASANRQQAALNQIPPHRRTARAGRYGVVAEGRRDRAAYQQNCQRNGENSLERLFHQKSILLLFF